MALILSVANADTYFATRMNSTAWDDIDVTGDVPKTSALTTAQNQLELFYSLDSTVQIHKNAVCEQALFLLLGGEGAEKRAALIAQGVIEAGIVEEKYSPGGDLVICPYAKAALSDVVLSAKRGSVFVADITRDDSDYEDRT